MEETLRQWQPRVLSILRIMSGLLFLQHGLIKHFSFPVPFPNPQALGMFSQLWFAGWIEIIGGILLILGLFTRSAAFVCSGFAAFAYFLGHAPRGFFPSQNGGDLAILYCFVFFYIFFAGPGPWSIDAARSGKSASA